MAFIEIEKGIKNNFTSKIRIDKKKNIVEKIINYGLFSDELFKREIYWLTKLYSTDIVPKLISCNPITHTIVMDWCGDILTKKTVQKMFMNNYIIYRLFFCKIIVFIMIGNMVIYW